MIQVSNAELFERRLIAAYGILLTRAQLAEVLQRRPGGLAWDLSRTESSLRKTLEPALLVIGRRCYYRATDLAEIFSKLERQP